jgi:hypothetical protein
MKYVLKKEGFLNTPHFAAIVFTSIYIPGDERSRTSPGHGYPAETRPIVQYITFGDRIEMEKWVARQEESKFHKTEYQIIEVKPLVAKTTITVVVE